MNMGSETVYSLTDSPPKQKGKVQKDASIYLSLASIYLFSLTHTHTLPPLSFQGRGAAGAAVPDAGRVPTLRQPPRGAGEGACVQDGCERNVVVQMRVPVCRMDGSGMSAVAPTPVHGLGCLTSFAVRRLGRGRCQGRVNLGLIRVD